MAQKLLLRKELIDEDTILSKEDIAALEEARREEAAGTLIPLEQVKRELGVNVRRRVR